MTRTSIEMVSADKPIACKPTAKSSRKPKTFKKVRLLSLLKRPAVATMSQLEKQFAWQPHTIRAAISKLRSDRHDILLGQSGKDARYRLAIAADQ